MNRRRFFRTAAGAVATAVLIPELGSGEVSLRVVRRYNGEIIRMSQLKIGDLFTLDDIKGIWLVTGNPTYSITDKMWGIQAKDALSSAMEASFDMED